MLAELLTVLVLAMTAAGGSPSPEAACPVKVLVLGRNARYAYGISGALKTERPLEVFISRMGKIGFRVLRVRADEPDKLGPELIEVRSRKIRKGALHYDFVHPEPLRVWWDDVAFHEPGGSSAFTVQPGRYRFSILFSRSDPSDAESKTIHVCKVYSDAFVLSEASHFLDVP